METLEAIKTRAKHSSISKRNNILFTSNSY